MLSAKQGDIKYHLVFGITRPGIKPRSYWAIGLLGRVFNNGPEYRSSIPGWVIPKTQKWYFMPLCLALSTIRYVSKVKWNNPRKELAPSLHLGVVANEKGTFKSPIDFFLLYSYQIHIIFEQIHLTNIWTVTGDLRSNGNEGVGAYFPELRSWDLTTGCSLISSPGFSSLKSIYFSHKFFVIDFGRTHHPDSNTYE